MVSYILRRAAGTLPLLLTVATLTFLLMHAVKGGPFDGERPMDAGTRARLEARYGLGSSLPSQYIGYLSNLARGDLGISFSNDRPVRDVIADRFPVSLHVGLLAFVFSVPAGIALGVASAVARSRWANRVSLLIAVSTTALPSFILAPLLVWGFAVKLHWFRVLGTTIRPVSLTHWDWLGDDWRILTLPTVALGLPVLAFVARLTRASVLDVLDRTYVRTARAKGIGEFPVLIRHVLRNAMVPLITVAGPIFAAFVAGSFVVERAFSIPGLGGTFVDAVANRDYGVIMGSTLFFAVVIAFANLAADIGCFLAAPASRS
jgi:oligopeptide transport system permease protein